MPIQKLANGNWGCIRGLDRSLYYCIAEKHSRGCGGAGGDTQLIYTEFSFLGFIIAFCIFRLFQLALGSVSPCGRMSRGLRFLSGYGYAVYLVHPLLLGGVSRFVGNLIFACPIFIWIESIGISFVISLTPLSTFFNGRRRIRMGG